MELKNIDRTQERLSSLEYNSLKVSKTGVPLTHHSLLLTTLRFVITVFCVLAVTAVLSPAFASSGGEGEVETVKFFSTGFMWSVINFSLVAFLLYKFGKEPLKDALAKRQETIRKTLDDAAEAKTLAEKGLKEAEKRLSEKDASIESILSDAKHVAERENNALVKQGERISKDIVERAKLSMGVELKQAKDSLRAEAVRLAIELAEKKISEETSADDQGRLIENYIGMMENRN